MTITVIIPTYNRPECIRENLSRLVTHDPQPDQVIVVDASPDDRTAQVAAKFPGILYLRNPEGRGNTPNSRNLALLHATGDVLAFLDDDAFVHPGWLTGLIVPYADPMVGGVAGRALNGVKGEEMMGVEEIGRLRANGTLSGNFAADSGRIIEVDHMIGCNMSLRRSVVAQLGGFRDDYRAGPFGIAEETEICLRAKQLGYQLLYNPAAVVDHVAAVQPGGRRFGPKYSYYHTRNVLVMLLRNFGLSSRAGRFFLRVATNAQLELLKRLGGGLAHWAMTLAGLVVGLCAGIRLRLARGRAPVRDDAKGRFIKGALERKEPFGPGPANTVAQVR